METLIDLKAQVTWAAGLQAAASIIGFIFVIYQMGQLRRNLRGATQDRVYAHYTEICKLFMQKPELYPFFYENKELDRAEQSDVTLSREIDIMSEAILGLIEHAALQKRNLPRDAWNNCWEPYAFERLDKSKEMKRFFNPNQGWYTQALRDIVKKYHARRADTKAS